jgi:hypothetical protein
MEACLHVMLAVFAAIMPIHVCWQMPASGNFRRGELKACIRSNFRAEVPQCEEKAAARLDLVFPPVPCHASCQHTVMQDRCCMHGKPSLRSLCTGLLLPLQAFDALRVLAEQHSMAACSAAAVTEGVRVEITTGFIGSRIPLDLLGETPTARPVWTYRCRVENVGCCSAAGLPVPMASAGLCIAESMPMRAHACRRKKVQLLGRQWLILTSEGRQHAVVPRGSTGERHLAIGKRWFAARCYP